MLAHIFLGLSLVGAEWVLYFLLILSVISVALIFERARFYRENSKGLAEFRQKIRAAVGGGKWDEALKLAQPRQDLESRVAAAVLSHPGAKSASIEVLTEIAHDAALRGRLQWEQNLSLLATIGSNAPFIGLFGTVLGIIKAFHDLSQQAGTGVATVTGGISESLVATAIGILVAIPATAAYN